MRQQSGEIGKIYDSVLEGARLLGVLIRGKRVPRVNEGAQQ